MINDRLSILDYEEYNKKKLDNNIIKFNVIDGFILSFLDLNIRLIYYEMSVNDYAHIITFTFHIKTIPFYKGKYRTGKESEIISRVKRHLYNRLKISNITIQFTPSLSHIGINNMESKISVIIKFTKEQMLKLMNTSEVKVFLKLYHPTGSIYDISYGIKLRYYYNTIYNVLYEKHGYTWYQYYSSILRFSWLDEYFREPNKFMNIIPSLLEYFAGIDEICLFDIVCKLHIRQLDIKYKSFIDMRYRLKESFMKKIPNFKILKFKDEWRLNYEDIHLLNNLHYIHLEVCFGSYELSIDTLFGFIGNENLEICQYLLKKIDMMEIYNNSPNIKTSLSISNFDILDRNKFYETLEHIDTDYLHKVFTETNINIRKNSIIYDG